MKSLKRITSKLPKLLLMALFLALVPAALARNIWDVDGINGNDNNDCKSPQTACKTIGHAISLCSSGDSIMVAPAIYTENLNIGVSLKIIGSDAPTTIVDGGGVNTVVTINSPGNVILSTLTIRNGYTQLYGGGIINGGTLTVIHSTITANGANFGGGGIFNLANLTIENNSTISGNTLSYQYGSGGGILNNGTLTVTRSTITANSAGDGGGVDSEGGAVVINDSTLSGNSATWGGATLFSGGTATINNSTFTGNSATAGGGGIQNYVPLTINNSTLSGNSATSGGGISQVTGYGGSVTFQNSIIANNSGGNCLTEPDGIYSNGYNLSDDGSCSFNGPGDMNNTKPKLGTFGNHGGPTQTIPLLPASPAVDAGNPNGCTDGNGNLLKTDQRGRPRPDKEDSGGCDIGAFERQSD